MKNLKTLLVGGLVVACGGSVETGQQRSPVDTAESSRGAESAEGTGGASNQEHVTSPPTKGGGGACGAVPDGATGYPGPGIGGAGFMVTTYCYACGFPRDSAECADLVDSTQMIDDPSYQSCWDAAYAFADCLDRVGTCGCDADVPAECASLQAASIACH